jgi:hypothetical protein
MQNGLLKTLNYALGAIKLCKDHKDATSWHVFAGKAFAICAVSHGSQITKIISNATFIERSPKISKIERKLFCKN